MALNIVIPAAGNGKRFADAGYKDPKPFIDVYGEPMLVRVTKNLIPNDRPCNIFWLVRQGHMARAIEIKQAAGLNVQCISVPDVTQGAACTVMLAMTHIDLNEPLLIANSDQLVAMPIQSFLDNCRGDGTILTFPNSDPKWSYVRRGVGASTVVEVAEKLAISNEATVGIYWFRWGANFLLAAREMVAEDVRFQGEFYLAPCYNELILRGNIITAYEIPASLVSGLGTPQDLESYLNG